MPNFLWRGLWRGRTPDGDIHLRARSIVRPTGSILRGKFPSRKNGRMVQHEGLLELDAIYLFETSCRVLRYREQPVTLQYPDGARLRRYTPDFELVLDGGEVVLVEVKPKRSLCKQEVRHKFNCIASHMERIGRTFVVLNEEHIRKEPRLSNLRLALHHAARVPPTREAALAALVRFQAEFPMSLRDASTCFLANKVDPYSLLLSGWLHCSLDAPLTLDTTIQLAEEPNHVWFWIAKEYGF